MYIKVLNIIVFALIFIRGGLDKQTRLRSNH